VVGSGRPRCCGRKAGTGPWFVLLWWSGVVVVDSGLFTVGRLVLIAILDDEGAPAQGGTRSEGRGVGPALVTWVSMGAGFTSSSFARVAGQPVELSSLTPRTGRPREDTVAQRSWPLDGRSAQTPSTPPVESP